MTIKITSAVTSATVVALALAPAAGARPSDPGVVNYAVLARGSVSNVIGSQLGSHSEFTQPFQAFSVDVPECNNWSDIGLDEVYADPDLASFRGAATQDSGTDATHLVKQSIGVFANNDAADRAFHRVVDRTQGCSGQTATLILNDGRREVWTFTGPAAGAADAAWMKEEAGVDRRCFNQTRRRENVLLQAKVCQPGNGSLAVNVLANTMQNGLGQ
ncbi:MULTISPECIES: sensor domain-containing protein [unclassified Mycobacterium]|uniref:sensor domain-containing protein n=1 Tax=unclassified Mycobacterium TaxID=2642494 RepID=UPI0009926D57|nr:MULTISPECIES: sensor domain-containing protein [unclassified Mycobacterium]